MVPAIRMKEMIPLIDEEEWERYLALPAQQPPPKTTMGRIEWWKVRRDNFPKLAPIAIAYLQTPRSAAQAERAFSLLGHIWKCTHFFKKNPHKQACRVYAGAMRGHLIVCILQLGFSIQPECISIDIQTSDRLNMCDSTLQALCFVYLNKSLFHVEV